MATFSLLTLNCFGVPTLLVRRRLLTLARELNRSDMTVVCLQEVQAHLYRRMLIEACVEYPTNAFWPFVHAPKGGLLTLGRLPFHDTHFTLYEERGIWYTLGLADWLLHKGILRIATRVQTVPVIVLNTHLNANYDGDWHPKNRFARGEQRQLQQLAALVAAQPAEALVVVAGDFNIPRGSWLYDEFLEASGLVDPLAGDPRPTYRLLPGMPRRFALPIDFVLFRTPRLAHLRVHADIVFHEKLPLVDGSMNYLSDHCGVELRFTWNSFIPT